MALFGGARTMEEAEVLKRKHLSSLVPRPLPNDVPQASVPTMAMATQDMTAVATKTLNLSTDLCIANLARGLYSALLSEVVAQGTPNELRLLWRASQPEEPRVQKWLQKQASANATDAEVWSWATRVKAPALVRHGLPSVTLVYPTPIDLRSEVTQKLRRSDECRYQLSMTITRMPRPHRTLPSLRDFPVIVPTHSHSTCDVPSPRNTDETESDSSSDTE